MTLYSEARVWLEQFPLGEPVPFSCDHLGIRYPGEVVRADTWPPGWVPPLEGEAHFRIVLLQQRRGGLRPAIQDPRIAICLPAAGLSRRRGRLTGELSNTSETQAMYLTQRDTEAVLIRQALQRRLEGLEGQLLGEDSVRYSEGQVLTGEGPGPDAASLFNGLEPVVWRSRLARWLLTQAYPTLPIRDGALQHPVERSDAAGLCRAVFGQPDAPPDILEQRGPGLGLSNAATPEVYDPSSCPVSELIRSRLSRISGDSFQSVYHSVRGIYSDYRHLEADLVLLRQLAELGRSTEDILRAQEYLEEAYVPPERFPSISVDRQTLQAALSPTNLVESRGRNWNVLVQDVSRFTSRFFASYQTHHETVHRQLPGYRKDLESAQRKLAALYLLNTLPKLGEPSGQELAEPLSELDQGLAPGTISSADLELESTPWCASCLLSMERVLPGAQLAWLLAAIDVELGAKNRELSTLLVERILRGQKNERLDDFLKIVQASDLAALSDTLTADLVVFIRRMLE